MVVPCVSTSAHPVLPEMADSEVDVVVVVSIVVGVAEVVVVVALIVVDVVEVVVAVVLIVAVDVEASLLLLTVEASATLRARRSASTRLRVSEERCAYRELVV